MITRNTDYSIQHLRGLSTDTKPTDVPNGSEFREMDTGKDFMYDEASGDWKEQPKKGGGGGGLPDGGNNGQVLTKTSNGAAWSDAGTPTQAQTNAALADYLDEHPEAVTNIPDRIKQALLACFQKVAWVDANGQTYYQNLYNALINKEVLSIAAVFTQGSATIYTTDSLDTLKQYLVVTASYDDGTTGEVTAYELSGTLTEGTSTITATYSGKTATFNVTVTENQVIATYVGGKAIAKTGRKCTLIDAAARMAMTEPIVNNSYVFTVTDSSKYQLAAYDITSFVYDDGYPGGDKIIAWLSSDSVTTEYVWVAFKKLDNTEFTAEEIDNAEGTVFTYTEGA